MLVVDNASIHFETSGNGSPMIFLHAGVADSRQWNNEFQYFASRFSVTRYDQRGYGNSAPVAGKFSHLGDLKALLDQLNISEPMILVGCSMGGGTALDFALAHPGMVKALVLVDSAPSGLELDVPTPPKFKLVEAAEQAGDIELVAELETQIWFDGDRDTVAVNPQARQLAYEMNLLALRHAEKALGERQPNSDQAAVHRLAEIQIPVLAVIGASDIPYMHAATDYMAAKISNFRKVQIEDAAHLPNLDRPLEFRNILEDFVESVLEE